MSSHTPCRIRLLAAQGDRFATRITFGALADFTSLMLETFPEFTSGAHAQWTAEYRFWDPDLHCWRARQMTLPRAGGQPSLLIPIGWAGDSLPMSSRRFYETAVLSYEQNMRATMVHGHIVKPRKADLKSAPGTMPGRGTNVGTATRADEGGQDPVEMFRAFVASTYLQQRQANRAA